MNVAPSPELAAAERRCPTTASAAGTVLAAAAGRPAAGQGDHPGAAGIALGRRALDLPHAGARRLAIRGRARYRRRRWCSPICRVLLLLGAVLAGPSDPGLGRAPPRLRRLAAACAPGAAVQRRRRRAHHRGRLLRRRVLPFRHPVLVQRSGARGAGESLQVSRGYLEEHRNNIRAVALEMANDLNRAGMLLAGASAGLRRGAGHPDRAARPDRGGDLRSATPARSWPRRACSPAWASSPPPSWAPSRR